MKLTAGGGGGGGGAAPLLLMLGLLHPSWLRPAVAAAADRWSRWEPRLQLSHADLRNGSAVFWGAGDGGGLRVLLLDEDGGRLLVGGRDRVHLLRPDGAGVTAATVYWPASDENVEHCLMAGKSPETDCANFVRLLQPLNKTTVLVCGSGAFSPQCGFLHLQPHGLERQHPSLTLSQMDESGRGKCPFSSREPFTAWLTDGDLYAGTSVDFMGVDAGIFRTSVQGGGQQSIRTEASDHTWLNEPSFVGSFSVPDTHSPDDDKVYFFFTERAAEAGQWDGRRYSRVARVCKNDAGGKRSLINRWTSFLKARLVCSVPGASGVDTHFDELEDIFVLETKDPQNPTVYGVFSTSSSVFRGSAVCVFPMASIRSSFNGPFAHRESPDHRWVEFKGRVPYPRPGTCPSETYDALYRSTKDLPDEAVSFVRQHRLMWDAVLPLGGRPVLTRLDAPYRLTKIVVDRVDAEDGPYDVLHLGTDDGTVLKVVSVPKDDLDTEQVVLEELSVFQTPTPVLSMQLSSKRQQLFISSDQAVVLLPLQRCQLYGSDCPSCCLSRDPYCSWDGLTCSRSFPPAKRRARRQDIKYGDPWTQCPSPEDDQDRVEVRDVFGVEGNATYLDCDPRPPAAPRWRLQQNGVSTELPLGDAGRFVLVGRGLLLPRLQPSDAGLYSCAAQERSYSRVLARYRLHVVPAARRPQRNQPPPPRSLKELQMDGGHGLSAQQRCQQLWSRDKRRQQKLRALKLKQESRKARVRRNYAPWWPLGPPGGPRWPPTPTLNTD